MKKRNLIVIFGLMMSVIMLSLCSCGNSKLSGKYISSVDSDVYIEFSGESKALYHDGDIEATGTYRREKDAVIAMFQTLSDDESIMIFQVKSDNTIYLNGLAGFEKESTWNKVLSFAKNHWKTIFVVIVVLGIIGTIMEKIENARDDKEKNTEKDKGI